jgi:hypothetical protein
MTGHIILQKNFRYCHGEHVGYLNHKIQAAVVSETMVLSTKLLGIMSHKSVITLNLSYALCDDIIE